MMNLRAQHFILLLLITTLLSCGSSEDQENDPPSSQKIQLKGWNILTNIEEEGMAIIDKIPEYGINYLQLSHHIIMDLRHVRNEKRRNLAKKLTKEAKAKGIPEVVVWDHAFYYDSYYPAHFRTGPDSTIDMDNPAFWKWFKDDYREMLALLPEIDGLVLTFIETGARAEQQYSEKWKTPAEKLAAVLNAVAEVVIEEKGMKLYARTFAYNDEEYRNLTECFEHVENQDIILMMKETPHDFFLLHPNNPLIGKIDRPTLVEFDLGNEYNGQGIIANTFPEVPYNRWKDFRERENVIGYVARVDRYGTTRSIGRPSEILPFTLDIMGKEPDIEIEEVYNRFIDQRYGEACRPMVKKAFQISKEIILSSLYTLGLNTTGHSRLNFHYRSIYSRHVSGRWLEDKTLHVAHGVDKDLHWFKDIVNHLSPPHLKDPDYGDNRIEMTEVYANGWLDIEELMNEEYLGYIITEKAHGVALAKQALEHIEAAKPHLSPSDYEDLYQTFERTLLSAQLREATAKAYYGYRIYTRGDDFRTSSLQKNINEGLHGILEYAQKIQDYPHKVPEGQWKWQDDGELALMYFENITKGWEEYGGDAYPFSQTQ